jgi:hypothetical protein
MRKRLGVFWGFSLLSLLAHAQWSGKDSLNLSRILNTNGEIKLNPNVVKEIDFGAFAGKQVMAKPVLNVDITLPKVFPERKEIKLSLCPYTVSTKYNYDPIFQKMIDIKSDTWRYGEKFRIKTAFIYSNWAKTPIDPGVRKSLDEIEATGMRYKLFENRANNRAVGSWGPAAGGGNLSGDFMAVFTKDFWDWKGRKRKARTLEVLQSYGDSATVQVREGIKR